jgi:acetylornithine deacetylase
MRTKLPDLAQMMDRLISHPSVSSTQPSLDMGNRLVIDELANWLGDLGFAIEIQPLRDDGKKANLVARRGEGTGGLIFSGHTDTVPCDENLWRSDPFRATATDAGLRGLGATDMKGFFAVILDTLTQMPLDNLTAPLIVVATADEESSFGGARQLSKLNLPSDAHVIIGEPTDMEPVILHKGIMMEAIQVKGVAGHSSDPSLGINALEVMREVLDKLLAYRTELQKQYRHPGFTIPVPTLNLGCIHGGDNPNRICSKCELQFDLRSVPGMQSDQLRDHIDRLLKDIGERWGATIERIALLEPVEAFDQSAESDLVRDISSICNSPAKSVAFATEAPFFQQLGLDTLILGPGSINQAHQANEYISYQQIEQGKSLYRQIIEHYCFI